MPTRGAACRCTFLSQGGNRQWPGFLEDFGTNFAFFYFSPFFGRHESTKTLGKSRDRDRSQGRPTDAPVGRPSKADHGQTTDGPRRSPSAPSNGADATRQRRGARRRAGARARRHDHGGLAPSGTRVAHVSSRPPAWTRSEPLPTRQADPHPRRGNTRVNRNPDGPWPSGWSFRRCPKRPPDRGTPLGPRACSVAGMDGPPARCRTPTWFADPSASPCRATAFARRASVRTSAYTSDRSRLLSRPVIGVIGIGS